MMISFRKDDWSTQASGHWKCPQRRRPKFVAQKGARALMLLRRLLQPSVHLLRSPAILSHAAAAPQLPLLASAARRHLCSGGNNKKAGASSARNQKADADIPTPEPQREPLSKLFTTLRGLWKLQTAGPELRKQMEARLAAIEAGGRRAQAQGGGGGEAGVRTL